MMWASATSILVNLSVAILVCRRAPGRVFSLIAALACSKTRKQGNTDCRSHQTNSNLKRPRDHPRRALKLGQDDNANLRIAAKQAALLKLAFRRRLKSS